MKVTVSLPDAMFSEAEVLARRLNASRSELYARALAAFLAAYLPDRVTETMNAVVDDVADAADPFVREAGRRVFDHVEW